MTSAKPRPTPGGSLRSGFLRLLISQILLKGLGLVRETVIGFYFKVSAATNYYFMIRGINESMLSVISGNTLGGVFIPHMGYDSDGKVRPGEIRRLTRMGWITGIVLAIVTVGLQFFFFFKRGAATTEYRADLIWVIAALGGCTVFLCYNACAGVLLQAVGDFRSLSSMSIIMGLGLVLGPIICRNTFGLAGITFCRLITVAIGAWYLRVAIARASNRFSSEAGPPAPGIDWRSLETWVMLTNLVTSNYFTVWYALTKASLGGQNVNSYFNYGFLIVNSLYGVVLLPLSTVLLPNLKRANLEGRAHNLWRVGWMVLGISVVACILSMQFIHYLNPLFQKLLKFPEVHARGVASATADLLWVLPGAALQVIFSQYIFVKRGVPNFVFNIIAIGLSIAYVVVLTMYPVASVLRVGSLVLFALLGAAAALIGMIGNEPCKA